jgi:hypothetical protein
MTNRPPRQAAAEIQDWGAQARQAFGAARKILHGTARTEAMKQVRRVAPGREYEQGAGQQAEQTGEPLMPGNLNLIRFAVHLAFSFAMTVIIAAGAFYVIVCIAGTG